MTSTTAVPDDLDAVLVDVAATARTAARDGEVVDYIPALRDADPSRFGLVATELDGTEHVTGDVDVPFSLQSISKLFTLVLAMQKAGTGHGVGEEIWHRVGREPSGDPFNSLVQLEHEQGRPRNPMINAGALVVHDVLIDHCADTTASLQGLLHALVGEEVEIDPSVMDAEERTGARNRAMAHLMASFGNLTHPVEDVLASYDRACSLSMTTRQLARAVRFLAHDGVEPASGEVILSRALARRVAALMLTCGTYDAAGEFAFSVGLPCKSGVAGGIVAFVPDALGLCVWSPPLEPSGNSRAGRIALHELTDRLGLSIF